MSDKWKEESRPARLEEFLPEGVVRCHLSPRNCTIKEGAHGFCGVRANRGGRLVTLNYGKGVHPTEETIETEAVNHFAPGERILSLGNVGCMLNCSYCHNWKTSQARFVSDRDVHYLTPESVVETAERHGIKCISWTYNDPVVWHEFILDTAKLAQSRGITNLYKSAFFITPEAVEELLPVIDIFSISIKSMSAEYYRKITTGWLQPVLDATKQVHKAGKHVEVSTLMVTDLSDDAETARSVAQWVLNDLDATVPLHLVRFHPDYKYTNTTRTPIPRLERAREIAMAEGVEHVYLGNVYDTPYSTTFCLGCQSELVTRYGLNAQNVGLDGKGHCKKCKRDAHFKHVNGLQSNGQRGKRKTVADIPSTGYDVRSFEWHGDIRSLHAQILNPTEAPISVYQRRRHISGNGEWQVIEIAPGESFRFIVAKSQTDEIGPQIALPHGIQSNLHEVFDRAHFPTIAVEDESAADDVTPLPRFVPQ
jgi:pyruvate formate lyase activating enzyme